MLNTTSGEINSGVDPGIFKGGSGSAIAKLTKSFRLQISHQFYIDLSLKLGPK